MAALRALISLTVILSTLTLCLAQSCGHVSDGEYYPDRSDPSSYFICAHGILLQHKCPEGYQFCVEEERCLKWCKKQYQYYGDIVDCRFEMTGKKFAMHDKCSEWGVCIYGKKKEYKCPGDTMFDRHTLSCSHHICP